ncbi:23S rRNA (uracil-5-)-methyltransferase RumA [Floricoccus penangensis]|uniref:23S rRNA (Uracil-5-)-methyltransferase RumA n=1 Tax=Floricoccus penangensis TaxID=1859475 RepID=A0A9Q5JIJ5_9LACT|nr:23S rRNA (uracil(1939)-C(5))-methyltransferase RlmD [Floricoccus penangensis]OFI47891.1 23S rRNA (uracil-5-)-methyltransferase RumA [Floricoccus penangensis]
MVYLKVGQKIPLKIKKMGINGEGIGNFKGQTVFVKGALPKEEVYSVITKAQGRYVEAEIVNINKKSRQRVDPACKYYEECGGCQIMHLEYSAQLEFKRDILKQSLQKFKPEGFSDYELRPTMGMKEPWHYRNKLQFQTRQIKDKVNVGLYAENSHRLIDIKDCLVQDQLTQSIINTIRNLISKYKLPLFDERRSQGLRTVMVRHAMKSDQVQLVFISSKNINLDRISKDLVAEYPQIKTIALNINTKKSSEIYGQHTEIIWGQEAINEEVLDYEFSLSPRAFYQLNSMQTNVLYQEAINALDVSENDNIIDAYCGVGTIGLAFASKVKSVRGMDVIAQGIDDAKKNAENLGFDNTHYEVGQAEDIIPKWYKEGYRADAIIVDPPRTGLDDKLLDLIVEYKPEKMVYVSCNVSTLARDLVKLSQVYNVEYLQSVDMFPQTARTECVVKLTRK